MNIKNSSIIAFVTLLASGCSSFLGTVDFDQDINSILNEKNNENLGNTGGISSAFGVDQLDVTDDNANRSHMLQPATTNPNAKNLPAELAPVTISKIKPESSSVVEGSDAAEDEDEIYILPVFINDDPNAKEFGLVQFLDYAIKNSPAYRTEKESLFLSTISLLSERHLWGPRFFDTINTNISGTPEAGDHKQVLKIVNELGVTQKLPNGGNVSASALTTFVEDLRNATTKDGNSQSAGLSLSADIPLLRGAGTVARESLIQSERNLIYSVRDFERYRREFFVQLADDYFSLIFQLKRIANNKAQVKSLEKLKLENIARVKAGRIANFELNRTEESLLNAKIRLSSSEESYVTQLESFKIRIGMPSNFSIKLAQSELVIPEPLLNNKTAIFAAFAYRLDLQTDFDRLDDSRRAVRNAKNNILPELNASASVTLPTHSGRTRAGYDIQPGDGSFSVGLNFDLALDRYVEKASHRRAVINLEQEIRNYKLQKKRIANAVRSNIRQIRLAKLSLDLQNKNVKIATKRLEEVNHPKKQDDVRQREKSEALQSLLEAENSRDESIKNLRVRILNYLLVTGQLRVNSKGQWVAPVKLVPAQK